jgi:hypothetical protein
VRPNLALETLHAVSGQSSKSLHLGYIVGDHSLEPCFRFSWLGPDLRSGNNARDVITIVGYIVPWICIGIECCPISQMCAVCTTSRPNASSHVYKAFNFSYLWFKTHDRRTSDRAVRQYTYTLGSTNNRPFDTAWNEFLHAGIQLRREALSTFTEVDLGSVE